MPLHRLQKVAGISVTHQRKTATERDLEKLRMKMKNQNLWLYLAVVLLSTAILFENYCVNALQNIVLTQASQIKQQASQINQQASQIDQLIHASIQLGEASQKNSIAIRELAAAFK